MEFYKKHNGKRNILVCDTECSECKNTYTTSKSNYTTAILKKGKYICAKCASSISRTHFKGSPIHNSYAGAKQRCNYKEHEAYSRYGGRGIKFLWDSFEEFHNDMSKTWFEGATLERIDLDGNYCVENCTWITREKQARNTSRNIHNEEEIQHIREMYSSGEYTQRQLAKIFNDSAGNISNIVNNRIWK